MTKNAATKSTTVPSGLSITIDPNTNKAHVSFQFYVELAGCLRLETLETWVLTSPEGDTVTCTSEANAKNAKKRVEDVAKMHGHPDPKLKIEHKPDLVRRVVADEAIIAHIKAESGREMQTALVECKITVPPI